MEEDIKKEREIVWVQILYLYLIPILLLYFKVVPSNFRILMLLVVTFLIYGIARYEKWDSEDFGIQKDWKKYFWSYLIFTIAGVGILFLVEELEIGKPFLNWWKNAKFLLLFIPLSFIQELIFRGVLMNMLRRVFTNKWFIIFLNASLFALMHIIYLKSYFTLPLAFIAGIGFAWMYYKYKNLILISASHAILNFIAMILGFFIIR
jgi:membrane protease YdiL (CAAX protease family)